jgi:hypothetical protein
VPEPVCIQTWAGVVPCRTSAYCRCRADVADAREAETDRVIRAVERALT